MKCTLKIEKLKLSHKNTKQRREFPYIAHITFWNKMHQVIALIVIEMSQIQKFHLLSLLIGRFFKGGGIYPQFTSHRRPLPFRIVLEGWGPNCDLISKNPRSCRNHWVPRIRFRGWRIWNFEGYPKHYILKRGLIRVKSIGCMQKQAVTGRFTRFTLSLNALTQSFMRLLKLHFGSMQVSFGMFNSAWYSLTN